MTYFERSQNTFCAIFFLLPHPSLPLKWQVSGAGAVCELIWRRSTHWCSALASCRGIDCLGIDSHTIPAPHTCQVRWRGNNEVKRKLCICGRHFHLSPHPPSGEAEGPGPISASTGEKSVQKGEQQGLCRSQQPFDKNHLPKLKKLTFLPLMEAQQASI